MERRKFLQNTCPTVTFAFFGISFIQACSKSDDEGSSYSSSPNNSPSETFDSGNQGTGTQTSGSQTNNGISVSGSTVTLDLTNSTFSTLNSPGDFVNLTSVGMLVLKISNTEFRAFDNCCPHNGAKNSWTYNNDNTFTCGVHGNTFNTDQGEEVSCGSNNTTGKLVSYTTSISDQTLTVQK